ncbi:hypothetical protein HYPSUDRAFT_204380 [Hypholoma sublateritium FD-334 SS-4]|uniref:Uncharacterized protein n=1 Tax=Hypholoma sublateritium (strain FD-334 SS-4) TaxID=945553 RepID=A0A0D2NSP8_HYPSF|nr:hypothetical protein HYPSUDRAFT_204380 [Hypholoma sublateritium FD-334 SS-4]
MLIAMDGNNSLKLVDSTFKAGSERQNSRSISSFRWLSAEEVDVFKDEVKKSAGSKRKTPEEDLNTSSETPQTASNEQPPTSNASNDHAAVPFPTDHPMHSNSETPTIPPPDIESDGDIAWLNVLESNELETNLNICVERWKSAGPEARKKMFALFAITGVFVAICHHGHILLVCDMIRSGEL